MIGYERFLKLRETEKDSASLNKIERNENTFDNKIVVEGKEEAKIQVEQEQTENKSEADVKTNGDVSPVNEEKTEGVAVPETNVEAGAEEKEVEDQEALTNVQTEQATKNLAGAITPSQNLNQDAKQQMGNVSQSVSPTLPTESEEKEVENQEPLSTAENKQSPNASQTKSTFNKSESEEKELEAQQDSTSSQVKNVELPPPLPPKKKIDLTNAALDVAKSKKATLNSAQAKRKSLNQGNGTVISNDVIEKETKAVLRELNLKDPNAKAFANKTQTSSNVDQLQNKTNANAQTQKFRIPRFWMAEGAGKMMDKYPSTGAFLRNAFNSVVEAVKKAVNPVFKLIYSRDIKKAQDAVGKLPTGKFNTNDIKYREDCKLLDAFYKNDFKRGLLERSDNKNDHKLVLRIREIVDPNWTVLNKDKVTAEGTQQIERSSAKRSSP